MAERLAVAASASLTSDITQERWATVLDAVAYSPVRSQVVPEGLPTNPNDQLLAAVRKVAGKVPAIAAAFGVEAPAPRRRGGRRTPPPPPAPAAPTAEASTPSPPPADAPAADAVAPEAPAEDAVVPETPTATEPVADSGEGAT
jgi:hypothetical protein